MARLCRPDYLRDLVNAGQSWQTQRHTAADGPRQWQWGGLQVTVMAPPPALEQERTGWAPRTENDRSLVLRLQYGGTRLLLTGDIEHSTERWLVAHRPDLQADILQIPHHGSKTSTSSDFVAQVRPTVGVISVGADNPYGHPHPTCSGSSGGPSACKSGVRICTGLSPLLAMAPITRWYRFGPTDRGEERGQERQQGRGEEKGMEQARD